MHLQFLPEQTEEFEKKVMEYHKNHMGNSPAAADFHLLDIARRIELYGVRMVDAKTKEYLPGIPVQDAKGVTLRLAIAHMGILVYQHESKIITFCWAKLRKLSFKRKKFLIKLHPDNCGYYKETVEFFFETRHKCKSFWKNCIEHHAFFRCLSVKQRTVQKPKLFVKGTSFRYCGRTQKELVEFVRLHHNNKNSFERSSSRPGISYPPSMPSERSAPALPRPELVDPQDKENGNQELTSSAMQEVDIDNALPLQVQDKISKDAGILMTSQNGGNRKSKVKAREVGRRGRKHGERARKNSLKREALNHIAEQGNYAAKMLSKSSDTLPSSAFTNEEFAMAELELLGIMPPQHFPLNQNDVGANIICPTAPNNVPQNTDHIVEDLPSRTETSSNSFQTNKNSNNIFMEVDDEIEVEGEEEVCQDDASHGSYKVTEGASPVGSCYRLDDLPDDDNQTESLGQIVDQDNGKSKHGRFPGFRVNWDKASTTVRQTSLRNNITN
jgi:hypothetical protein